jgi:hypothetical protein
MTERTLAIKGVRQLQKRYQELQSEITQLGWIAQSSLMHKAPNAWRLTRKIKAKTLTIALSQEQASLFAQAIANHRRLEELLSESDLHSASPTNVLCTASRHSCAPRNLRCRSQRSISL